jgi:hypothetical protein
LWRLGDGDREGETRIEDEVESQRVSDRNGETERQKEEERKWGERTGQKGESGLEEIYVYIHI